MYIHILYKEKIMEFAIIVDVEATCTQDNSKDFLKEIIEIGLFVWTQTIMFAIRSKRLSDR